MATPTSSSTSFTSSSASSTASSSASSLSLPDLSTATIIPTTTSSGTSTTSASRTGPGGAIVSLSGLPTIAGAGIPSMVVPFTANAPFMQKSSLPEGTVFIAVGAVLAFLGACVLLWRGLVAWSINRSVKRAALASLRGSEKLTSAWSSGRGGVYKEIGAGSTLSLDALNSSGKPIRSHLRDDVRRESTPPPGLFFSPTAKTPGGQMANAGSRNSSYLPAGYYAPPSSQAAGGVGSTTIGANPAPYARYSSHHPSPPASPALGPVNRSSPNYRMSSSRDGLAPPGNGSVRNSYVDPRMSHVSHISGLHQSYSNSNLRLASNSSENLGGSRAPSAVLDDMFENHGTGPRERY